MAKSVFDTLLSGQSPAGFQSGLELYNQQKARDDELIRSRAIQELITGRTLERQRRQQAYDEFTRLDEFRREEEARQQSLNIYGNIVEGLQGREQGIIPVDGENVNFGQRPLSDLESAQLYYAAAQMKDEDVKKQVNELFDVLQGDYEFEDDPKHKYLFLRTKDGKLIETDYPNPAYDPSTNPYYKAGVNIWEYRQKQKFKNQLEKEEKDYANKYLKAWAKVKISQSGVTVFEKMKQPIPYLIGDEEVTRMGEIQQNIPLGEQINELESLKNETVSGIVTEIGSLSPKLMKKLEGLFDDRNIFFEFRDEQIEDVPAGTLMPTEEEMILREQSEDVVTWEELHRIIGEHITTSSDFDPGNSKSQEQAELALLLQELLKVYDYDKYLQAYGEE